MTKKKKCKIKFSAFKHSLHETNYVHRKDCLRSTEKDAFNIEIWALVKYNNFYAYLNKT